MDELLDFGLTNIRELDSMISEYLHKAPLIFKDNNFAGILRNVMILSDIDNYFKNAWNKNWYFIEEVFVDIAKDYGVDIAKYLEDNEVSIYIVDGSINEYNDEFDDEFDEDEYYDFRYDPRN